MIGLAVGIAGMGALVALRWPGGFATADGPAEGLGAGLADAFTINALLALATAALAYFTLGQAGAKRSSSPEGEDEGQAIRAAAAASVPVE